MFSECILVDRRRSDHELEEGNMILWANRIMLPCPSSWSDLHLSTSIHSLNIQASYQVIICLFGALADQQYAISIGWWAHRIMLPSSSSWSDLHWSARIHSLNIQASYQVMISLFGALADQQYAIYCINWLVGAHRIMLPSSSSWSDLHPSARIHSLNIQASYQVIISLFRALADQQYIERCSSTQRCKPGVLT